MNRLQQRDVDLCIRFNSVSAYSSVEWFFRAVSRLGNGVFWYSLMLILLAVYGKTGWQASLHMLLSAAPALLIYKVLKRTTARQRPCRVHPRIKQKTAALDQFSFPSGHTLHAVNFTLVCGHYLPELLAPLGLFSALVASSRPVLGLHYPSDVAAGALLGTLVAAGRRAGSAVRLNKTRQDLISALTGNSNNEPRPLLRLQCPAVTVEFEPEY